MVVWATLIAIFFYGVYTVYRTSNRTAEDVLLDLEEVAEGVDEVQVVQKGLKIFSDELGKIGIFDPKKRRTFTITQKILPLAFIVIPLLIQGILGNGNAQTVIMTCLIGWGFGYIVSRRRVVSRREAFQKALEYNLPLVMERIVMGVEAGLDIVSALQNIIKLEREGLGDKIDPVTRLLEVVMALSNAGLRFETALSDTANAVDNSSIRHAFVHLSVAYKEGGELIMPLRELSDATQLQYQEILEEEIAELPIKATMPLVLVFAGLIICFLTGPIVQIIKTMGEAMPQ